MYAVLAAGALVGWFAPDLGEPAGDPGSRGQELASTQPEQLAVAQSWGGNEVILPRARDGHFYADVTIDGTASNMLVDTGASMVALTAGDAEAMGIYWDEAEVRPVARGATGPVYGVNVVLDRVQVGDIEVAGVEAVVVPEGLGISLLGQSFLSRAGRIESDDEKMVLGG